MEKPFDLGSTWVRWMLARDIYIYIYWGEELQGIPV